MKEAFIGIKEKIISWTSNRVASAANMDIGNFQMGYQPWEDASQCQGCEPEYESEMDVNMMGKCYTCGIVGHPARLCPKGRVKGQNAGKGFVGKGGYKGFGGKGGGFKGKGGGFGGGFGGKGGAFGGGGKGDNQKGTFGYQGFCFK